MNADNGAFPIFPVNALFSAVGGGKERPERRGREKAETPFTRAGDRT